MDAIKRKAVFCAVLFGVTLGLGFAGNRQAETFVRDRAANRSVPSRHRSSVNDVNRPSSRPRFGAGASPEIHQDSMLFQQAEDDWNNQRWEEAVTKFRQIARSSSPDSSRAHIQIGKYYRFQRKWDEAIVEYELAIAKAALAREIEDARTSIAEVHSLKGDYEEAMSTLRDVLSSTADWQRVKYCTYQIKELKKLLSIQKVAADETQRPTQSQKGTAASVKPANDCICELSEDKLGLRGYGDSIKPANDCTCQCTQIGTQCPNTDDDEECVNPTLLVNTVSLNLVAQETDLSYRGRGPSVEITRVYNSDDPIDGPFGRSWTFNHNMKLGVNPDGSVDIRRESGTIHRYALAAGNQYTPPTGIYDSLVRNLDGTYSLTLKGSRVVKKFNSTGRLSSIIDRNGNSMTLQYDSGGRLVSMSDAVGRTTSLTYGSNGKIASLRDPIGRIASYTYDSNNNLVSTTDMAGNIVTYGYDNPTCLGGTCSYMTSVTTARGATRIAYAISVDGFDLSSITDPLGNVRTYVSDLTFSGIGLLVRVTDENNNQTLHHNTFPGYTGQVVSAAGRMVRFDYDSRGNRILIADSRGNAANLAYDARGNVTRVTDTLGNAIQLSYDSRDNLTRLFDPAGNAYVYEYDSRDNLTEITDPATGVTTFGYNSFGELTRITDARNNSTTFSYDNAGNMITSRNPVGGTDSYTYDGVGRVISHTDPKGNTVSYSYDGVDRLARVSYPDGSARSYSYGCCRLNSVTDQSGTLTFTYDSTNRLIRYTDVYGKTISYGYDRADNLTNLTYPDGKVVRYEYDKANHLTKVTDWLNRVTTYEYDSGGNLLRTTYPDRSTAIHQYDRANRLTALWDYKADGTASAVFDYTLNSSGNRTAVAFNQPLSGSPLPQNVSYTYDSDNRLLAAGSATFSYDNNGNLIRKAVGSDVSTYAWNLDNMLTQVASGGKTFSYKYDGLGNRVSRVGNSAETRYVVDPSGLLSRVLAETNSSGSITAYYVYGLGLVSKIAPDGRAYFYRYDGLGNAIAVTDSSGNLVNSYAYGAYGNVISQTETITDPFRYVGRYGVMDENNGLLFMRARYYDKETGRFINKDPIRLLGGLNLYAYVKNDPINTIDPKGKLGELLSAGVVVPCLYFHFKYDLQYTEAMAELSGGSCSKGRAERLTKFIEFYKSVLTTCGQAAEVVLKNPVPIP